MLTTIIINNLYINMNCLNGVKDDFQARAQECAISVGKLLFLIRITIIDRDKAKYHRLRTFTLWVISDQSE